MRKLWAGDRCPSRGSSTLSRTSTSTPRRPRTADPFVYCGNSVLSVRKAVEYCDGWMPGRIKVKTFRKRVERLAMLSEEAGREMPEPGCIPIVSPGKTREEGLSHVNWPEMMGQAIKSKWETPDSGGWTTPHDLEGALIAGNADDIAEGVAKFHDAGLKHLVFDLRFRYETWLECLQFLGEEVLPIARSSKPVPVAGVAR